MKRIGEIISSKRLFGIDLKKLPIIENIWIKEFSCFSKFSSIVGIERNILVIKAHNSVIANEIKIKKNSLIKEINKYFKSEIIGDIKIIL